MSTYLIMGANRGIGYEFCRQLQARGETVIAVCRTASEQLKQLGVHLRARPTGSAKLHAPLRLPY